MLDYPNVRSGDVCPLCGKGKDAGLVACWPCYHGWGLRYGNAEADALIEKAEENLRQGVGRYVESGHQ